MIVELLTVRGSIEESYEKEQEYANAEKIGTTEPDFRNKDDYVTHIIVDMDTVIDYSVGKVWLNDREMICIYPRTSADDQLPNLLVSKEVFKKIYEEAKGVTIENTSKWK